MHGMHMAMLVACGFAVVGIIVVVAFLPARAGADPDADASDRGTEDGGVEGHVELAPGSDGTTAEREPTATGARG
jgi:hypothetical protein